jgi:hypothetical protein
MGGPVLGGSEGFSRGYAMSIKTVNADNLAEYVGERRAKGSEISTPEQVTEAAEKVATAVAPKSPVVAEEAETISDSPDPGSQTPTAKKKDVQSRIDELTRLRKETEEFAEDEYNKRLRAERRIGELEARLNVQPEVKPVEELKRPSPKDFADQESYDKAMEGYEAKRDERTAEQTKIAVQQQIALERQNELIRQRVERAKADIPDFVAVIEAKDRLRQQIPAHIQAAIAESELGPQLAYHLAKHEADERRIFAMTPARALLELGKIEEKYVKAPEVKAEGVTPTTETSKAPAPVTSLKADGGIVQVDLSQPMGFNDYRKVRLEEIRKRRRH